MCEGHTLTSSGEHLLSCFHLQTKHSSAVSNLTSGLQAAAPGAAECFDTCCHFTDDFGKLVELDVVITLKLQQHHLQVHVVTHLKLPHFTSRLPVQGCCRGNVAEDTEMATIKDDSLREQTDLAVERQDVQDKTPGVVQPELSSVCVLLSHSDLNILKSCVIRCFHTDP